jgi:hypothetical protein
MYQIDLAKESVRPAVEQLQSQQGAWAAFIIPIIVWVLTKFGKLIAGPLPLWERTLMHTAVVKYHQRRSLYFAFLLPLIILGLQVFSSWNNSKSGGVDFGAILNSSGTFLLILCGFGLVSYGLGFLQYSLSVANFDKVLGNGYGLLNLHVLFTKGQPSQTLTYLQDGILAIVIAVMFFDGRSSRVITSVIAIAMVEAILLGYTLWCQNKFKDIVPRYQNEAGDIVSPEPVGAQQ